MGAKPTLAQGKGRSGDRHRPQVRPGKAVPLNLLRQVQLKLENNGTPDLSDEQIESVCTHLSIAKEDRWPFDKAEAAMLGLAKDAGDTAISYIIDLNDAQGAAGNTRGLELLKALHGAGSKATAFLLTHYATKSNEAEKELELRNTLLQEGSPDVSPVCVIAKERLYSEGDAASSTEGRDGTVAKALRIAIKRAGLRRNVHEVFAYETSGIILSQSLGRVGVLSESEKKRALELVERFHSYRIIREDHPLDDWVCEALWPAFQKAPYVYPSAMSGAVAYGLSIDQTLQKCVLEGPVKDEAGNVGLDQVDPSKMLDFLRSGTPIADEQMRSLLINAFERISGLEHDREELANAFKWLNERVAKSPDDPVH